MDGSASDLGEEKMEYFKEKDLRGRRRGIGRPLQQQGWGLSLSSPFLGLMPSSPFSRCVWCFLLQASRDPDTAPSLVKLRLACSPKLCSSARPYAQQEVCFAAGYPQRDTDSSVNLNNGQTAWPPLF